MMWVAWAMWIAWSIRRCVALVIVRKVGMCRVAWSVWIARSVWRLIALVIVREVGMLWVAWTVWIAWSLGHFVALVVMREVGTLRISWAVGCPRSFWRLVALIVRGEMWLLWVVRDSWRFRLQRDVKRFVEIGMIQSFGVERCFGASNVNTTVRVLIIVVLSILDSKASKAWVPGADRHGK